ncbi:hypothetical protein ABPG72_011557 [Tetrahymena utriculariae]
MKILIVDFYKNSPKGTKRFSNYQQLVKEMVLSQKVFPDTETHFFIRDKNNLGDVLYEIGSQYKNKNNVNFFQTIDFIFMEGDISVLPWSSHYETANILLRMCLNFKKRCFISGGLSSCIIYQSSDKIQGYQPIVHVDRNAQQLFQDLMLNDKLNENDYILDSTTGDVYQYQRNYENKYSPSANSSDFKKKDEVVQKGNLGLHQEKDAEDNQNMGKFVIKSNVFRDQQQYGQKLVVCRITEELIYFHKKHNCHYIINQLPHQLKINSDNRRWNVHPYIIQNNLFRYDIIAESQKSKVSIIQMSNNSNMFALFFVIDQLYDQSYQLMKNFFNEKIREMGCDRSVLQSPVKIFDFKQQQFRTPQQKQDNQFQLNTVQTPISFIRNGKSPISQKKQDNNCINETQSSSSLSKRVGMNSFYKGQLAQTNINQQTFSHVTQIVNLKNSGLIGLLSRTQPVPNQKYIFDQKSLSPIKQRNSNRDFVQQNRSFQNENDRVFIHQGVNPFETTKSQKTKAENTLIDTSTLFTTRRAKEALQKTPKQTRDISLIKEKQTYNKKLLLISDISLDQYSQFQNNSGPKIVSQNRPFLNLKKYTDEKSDLTPYISFVDHKFRDESPNKWVGSPWKKI